jgi:hypothetical protein
MRNERRVVAFANVPGQPKVNNPTLGNAKALELILAQLIGSPRISELTDQLGVHS